MFGKLTTAVAALACDMRSSNAAKSSTVFRGKDIPSGSSLGPASLGGPLAKMSRRSRVCSRSCSCWCSSIVKMRVSRAKTNNVLLTIKIETTHFQTVNHLTNNVMDCLLMFIIIKRGSISVLPS